MENWGRGRGGHHGSARHKTNKPADHSSKYNFINQNRSNKTKTILPSKNSHRTRDRLRPSTSPTHSFINTIKPANSNFVPSPSIIRAHVHHWMLKVGQSTKLAIFLLPFKNVLLLEFKCSARFYGRLYGWSRRRPFRISPRYNQSPPPNPKCQFSSLPWHFSLFSLHSPFRRPICPLQRSNNKKEMAQNKLSQFWRNVQSIGQSCPGQCPRVWSARKSGKTVQWSTGIEHTFYCRRRCRCQPSIHRIPNGRFRRDGFFKIIPIYYPPIWLLIFWLNSWIFGFHIQHFFLIFSHSSIC